MKTMKSSFIIIMLFAVVIFSSSHGHAELLTRGTDNLGNQLIYDDDLNITWYDYTNAVETWYYHTSWANTLSVNFSGTIYDDWRLPVCTNMSMVSGLHLKCQ